MLPASLMPLFILKGKKYKYHKFWTVTKRQAYEQYKFYFNS